MILLASQSPRRAELLRQIGIAFKAVDASIDESWHRGEEPADYVVRMAKEKAAAGLHCRSKGDPRLVLAADTSVVLDDQILGKPQDRRHALDMLGRLSGRCHRVLTAVAIIDGGGYATDDVHVSVSDSRVWFRELSDSDCEQYWQTGEPLGKAGAYAIQGRAAVFIERLEGSYSGVMGLPLFETATLLKKTGYAGQT